MINSPLLQDEYELLAEVAALFHISPEFLEAVLSLFWVPKSTISKPTIPQMNPPR